MSRDVTRIVSFAVGIAGLIIGIVGVTLAIVFGTAPSNCPAQPTCPTQTTLPCATRLFSIQTGVEGVTWDADYSDPTKPKTKQKMEEISNQLTASLNSGLNTPSTLLRIVSNLASISGPSSNNAQVVISSLRNENDIVVAIGNGVVAAATDPSALPTSDQVKTVVMNDNNTFVPATVDTDPNVCILSDPQTTTTVLMSTIATSTVPASSQRTTNVPTSATTTPTVIACTTVTSAVPVTNPGTSAAPVTTPGTTAVPASSPATSAAPVSTIGTSAVTVSTPGTTAVPASSPATSAVPASSPGTSAVPASTIGTSAVPASTPGTSSVPVSTPGTTAVPASSSATSAEPVSTSVTSAVPASTSVTSAVPVSTSVTSAVPANTSVTSAVPVSTPGTTAVPASSSATSAVPASTPGTSAVPVSTSGTSAVPASTTVTSAVPVSTPGTTAVPGSSPGTSAVPVSTPGTSAVPASSPATSAVPVSSTVTSDVPASSTATSAVPNSSPATSAVPVSTPGTSAVPTSGSETSASTPGTSAVPASSTATSYVPTSTIVSSTVPSSLPVTSTEAVTSTPSIPPTTTADCNCYFQSNLAVTFELTDASSQLDLNIKRFIDTLLFYPGNPYNLGKDGSDQTLLALVPYPNSMKSMMSFGQAQDQDGVSMLLENFNLFIQNTPPDISKSFDIIENLKRSNAKDPFVILIANDGSSISSSGSDDLKNAGFDIITVGYNSTSDFSSLASQNDWAFRITQDSDELTIAKQIGNILHDTFCAGRVTCPTTIRSDTTVSSVATTSQSSTTGVTSTIGETSTAVPTTQTSTVGPSSTQQPASSTEQLTTSPSMTSSTGTTITSLTPTISTNCADQRNVFKGQVGVIFELLEDSAAQQKINDFLDNLLINNFYGLAPDSVTGENRTLITAIPYPATSKYDVKGYGSARSIREFRSEIDGFNSAIQPIDKSNTLTDALQYVLKNLSANNIPSALIIVGSDSSRIGAQSIGFADAVKQYFSIYTISLGDDFADLSPLASDDTYSFTGLNATTATLLGQKLESSNPAPYCPPTDQTTQKSVVTSIAPTCDTPFTGQIATLFENSALQPKQIQKVISFVRNNLYNSPNYNFLTSTYAINVPYPETDSYGNILFYNATTSFADLQSNIDTLHNAAVFQSNPTISDALSYISEYYPTPTLPNSVIIIVGYQDDDNPTRTSNILSQLKNQGYKVIAVSVGTANFEWIADRHFQVDDSNGQQIADQISSILCNSLLV